MKSFTDFDKVDEATKYVVHYTDSKGQHVNSSKAFDDKKKADAHAAKGNSIDKVGGKYSVKPMQNEAARALALRALETSIGEQAPVAPTIDRKYIKGTPEHKAYKATKKPINGHPTNVKEDTEELGEELYAELHEVLSKDATASDFIHDFVKSDDPKFSGDSKAQRIKRALGAYYGQQKEESELDEATPYYNKPSFLKRMGAAAKQERLAREKKEKESKEVKEGWDPEQFGSDGSGAGGAGAGDVSNKDKKKKKTLREFSRDLLEYESDKSGRYVHTKGSYGKSYDSEKDDNDDKPQSTEKRGRGRPAGSKSGARSRSSTGKSYGGVATHSLNLPNSNK